MNIFEYPGTRDGYLAAKSIEEVAGKHNEINRATVVIKEGFWQRISACATIIDRGAKGLTGQKFSSPSWVHYISYNVALKHQPTHNNKRTALPEMTPDTDTVAPEATQDRQHPAEQAAAPPDTPALHSAARQVYLQDITRRLVIFTAVILVIMALFLYGFIHFQNENRKSYLVLLVFVTGLLGGFVSIQQRLPKITLEEMKVLSASWVSITLIPINGGIFAVVLMLMFAGNIIQGQLFPTYPDDFKITDTATFHAWMRDNYPVTGVDIAKLLFWSFVAGFSERFVPQVIRRTTDEISKPDSDARPSAER